MNDDNNGSSRPWRMFAAGAVAVLCGLAVAFLVARPQFGDDGSLPVAAAPTSEELSTIATIAPAPTDPPPTTDADTSDSPTTVADNDEDAAVTVTSVADDAEDPPASAPVDPPDDADSGDTDPAAAPPPSDATNPTGDPQGSADAPSYPTLEDGTPVPIVVIFDGDTIAISGTAPSQAASDRLETLAIANSAVPNASVVNFVTINPEVPISVGVRVIEMQSPRFPESSAEILPGHALQLSRAVAVMSALPNISCVVIGHADQRGNATRNYEISADRAQSVVDYMASQGIDPARLASRAVGASDLLTLNNDAVAFELNRRTEFVFYGLLVE